MMASYRVFSSLYMLCWFQERAKSVIHITIAMACPIFMPRADLMRKALAPPIIAAIATGMAGYCQ